MSKWEGWNRAASKKEAGKEISEGKEEYRREESGRIDIGEKYWTDEDYGNYDDYEDEYDSGYEMHGVYYDEEMQMLEENFLKGDFTFAGNILSYYKKINGIKTVLKNVAVSYLLFPKEESEALLNKLAVFLKQTNNLEKENFDFSLPEFLESSEIEDMIIYEAYNHYKDEDDYDDDHDNFRNMNVEMHLKIINGLNISSEKKEKICLKMIKSQLENGYLGYNQKLKEQFSIYFKNIDFKELEDSALTGLKNFLFESTRSALSSGFLIDLEKLNSSEVKKIVIEAFQDHLFYGNIDKAIEIQKQFVFLNETSEVENMIVEALIRCLSESVNIYNAIKIKENFPISPEKLNSSEVEQAVLKGLSYCFKNNSFYIGDVAILRDNFVIFSKKLETVVLEGLVFCLSENQTERAILIAENFPLPSEKFNFPEFKKVALFCLNNLLLNHSIDKAIKLENIFSIVSKDFSPPEIEESVLNCLDKILLSMDQKHTYSSQTIVEKAVKVKEIFPINPERLEEIILKDLLINLEKMKVDDALLIRETFSVSQKKFDSPEVEKLVLLGLNNCLLNKKVFEAVKIKKNFNLSSEKLNSSEIKQAIEICLDKLFSASLIDINMVKVLLDNFPIDLEKKEELIVKKLIGSLLSDNLAMAVKINKNFSISSEKINSSEVQQAVVECISKLFSVGHVEEATEIEKNSLLAPEKLEEVVFKNLIIFLSKGHSPRVIQIRKNFSIAQEKLNSPEIEDLALICLENSLLSGRIKEAVEVKNLFSFSMENLEKVALEVLINHLSKKDYFNAIEIIKNFLANVSLEKLNSPEIEESAIICLNHLLLNGSIEKGVDLKNRIPIAPEKLEEVAYKNLIKLLLAINANSAIKIKNNFNISSEKLNSQELESAGLICLDKILLEGRYIDSAIQLKNEFAFAPEKLEEVAFKNLKIWLVKGRDECAIKIKNNFLISSENLSSPELEKDALSGIALNLSGGYANEAIKIKNNFPVSLEKLNSPEIEKATLMGVKICLLKIYVNDALKIKDNFPIFSEKLEDIVLECESINLWTNKISSSRARDIIDKFLISPEEILQKYFLKPNPQKRKSVEFIGAILKVEERKAMIQKFGSEAEILFYSGEIKARKRPSSEERKEIILEFKKKIADSINNGTEDIIFNKLVYVIKELDNQRGNDEQSTADFLFEISKDLSGKLDDRKFLILIRKLSEINDPKANFSALRLAGQSRVKPLAFIRTMQKLSANNFIPKIPSQLISEKKNGKKQLNQEKIAIFQKIISEYPNQFSTAVSTFSDLRFDNFDLIKNRNLIFSGLRELGALTPAVFYRYCKLDELERSNLVKKINQTKPILFKNQPVNDVFQGRDRESFAEMVYLAYNPVGMDLNDVIYLSGSLKDRTQDLAEYKFPENGYDFSLNDKKGYQLKKGEKINQQVINRIADIFSGNYPKNEDEVKKISGIIAKLAKGGTDLKDEEVALLISLFSEEEQAKEFKEKIMQEDISPMMVLNGAKENLGVFFNDNFSRVLEQFLSENSQSKEKLEAIFSRPERLELIKKKIGKQLEEKNFEIDWNNLSQIITACFSVFVLKKLRQEISKEIKKYELAPEGEGEEMSLDGSDLKAYISKNVGSFFAKASAGICTARDVSLFNRKDHFHINIIENNQSVRANIQAYIISYPEGKKSLFLRGINPNVKFEEKINVPAFCDKVIEIAKQFQKDNNLEGVYLSEQLGGWHALSNRAKTASYLSEKYLKKNQRREFDFSIKEGTSISHMFEV